jgi:Zn-dependent M28 family amino/carboxypeptidase
LLELARAFARGPRPARSMLFVSVSGEEKGLWGSGYFVTHPTVPLGSIVADINIDMIGRNWRDTVGVIGREHSDLGRVLDSVAARHRELDMAPIGDVWPDQGRFYRSDHYNFARHGVPILFLSSGYAPEYHEPTDEPKLIDAEKEARLVRLIYYFALAVADRTARPRWTPESLRTIATER